jgi:hypothetical protein
MLYMDCSCLNLALGIFLEFLEFLEYFYDFNELSSYFQIILLAKMSFRKQKENNFFYPFPFFSFNPSSLFANL